MTTSDERNEYAAAAAGGGGGMLSNPYMKALAAALGVAASGLSAAQPDVSITEWIVTGVLTVAAGLGVWYAPYVPKRRNPRKD
jgi:hypothetical protein